MVRVVVRVRVRAPHTSLNPAFAANDAHGCPHRSVQRVPVPSQLCPQLTVATVVFGEL